MNGPSREEVYEIYFCRLTAITHRTCSIPAQSRTKVGTILWRFRQCGQGDEDGSIMVELCMQRDDVSNDDLLAC